MDFFLDLKDPCTYFLIFLLFLISFIIYKYRFSKQETYQKERTPEPVPEHEESKLQPITTNILCLPKRKLRLLRLPLVAFKEFMLSMDLNDIINLSSCSKYTTNTIKLFQRSYFKEITNCKMEFLEYYCCLKFCTPTSLKKYFFFDAQKEKHVSTHKDSYYYYCLNPFEAAQKFAKQFLEISDCRDIETSFYERTVLDEFVSWANNYKRSIKLVNCLENINGNTIFSLLKLFENWERVVLIHRCAEFHLIQTVGNKSVSIQNCNYYMLHSFWKLPHQSIHFSKNVFEIGPFTDYLRSWIACSIPCTELVDFTAELYPPNYFVTILRNVEVEEVDEEWIHPIHGKINSPNYKIQRSDQKKSALLFKFQKDGEPYLGMHIY
ncbi:unnamed protein product [Caenorhabditis brenneri]